MTDADKKRFAHVIDVWKAYRAEVVGIDAAAALTLAHFLPYTVTPKEYCPPEADEAS